MFFPGCGDLFVQRRHFVFQAGDFEFGRHDADLLVEFRALIFATELFQFALFLADGLRLLLRERVRHFASESPSLARKSRGLASAPLVSTIPTLYAIKTVSEY